MKKIETVFSEPDREYRYTLWREFPSGLLNESLFGSGNIAKDGFVQFIGLNPSTADETKDDPTIRRLIGFAKSWGYSALCMTNAYAFRSTDPKFMKKQLFPIGELNDRWLYDVAVNAALVVCCWGRHGAARGEVVADMLRARNVKLHYFRLLSGNVPEHPLYLPKTLAPVPWTA
jgi:hypothetical protein